MPQIICVSKGPDFQQRLLRKVRDQFHLAHVTEVKSIDPQALYLVDELEAQNFRNHEATKVVVTTQFQPALVSHWLDQGFDEVLSFECDPVVWLARLKKAARAIKIRPSETLDLGVLRLNMNQQRAYRKAQLGWDPVDLTPLEFRVLRQLCKQPGRPFSRRELHEAVWGGEVHLSLRNIDTHICKLRQKIAHPQIEIQSSRGLGYTLTVHSPVQVLAEALPFRGTA